VAAAGTGSVEMSSEPGGAIIYSGVEGKKLGQTLLQLDQQPVGEQKYEVFKDGYQSEVVKATVQTGTAAKVSIKLKPLEKPVEGQDWRNTLGMRFTYGHVEGVLVSVWETRVRDFQAFIDATGYDAGDEWSDPGFDQVPNDCLIRVSWFDARKFCDWLTDKERKAGLLGPNQYYRIPTDAEWSIFAVLRGEPDGTPEQKSENKENEGVYPWGTGFPPPKGAGNYGGNESTVPNTIKDYSDGFPNTAPVGSFTPNVWGLYDMGGNASEWCLDWMNATKTTKVIRGANYFNDYPSTLLSSYRLGDYTPNIRPKGTGFRCVLVLDPAKELPKPVLVDDLWDQPSK
jgi:hypothetical protein